MAQTWDVTLLPVQPAAGYGNTISEGYGSASGGTVWPVTLLDGTATGYGNTTSSGFDDGAVRGAGAVVWYSLDVTVLAEGATRPFHAPLDLAYVTAPLDVANVLAPLDIAAVFAPLDVANVLAPLDMETETA